MFSNSLDRGQAALRGDVELEADIADQRRGADAADRGLHVLRLHRLDDVVGRDVEARHAVEVQPDAHRVVERAEQRGIADAGHAAQRVEQR